MSDDGMNVVSPSFRAFFDLFRFENPGSGGALLGVCRGPVFKIFPGFTEFCDLHRPWRLRLKVRKVRVFFYDFVVIKLAVCPQYSMFTAVSNKLHQLIRQHALNKT